MGFAAGEPFEWQRTAINVLDGKTYRHHPVMQQVCRRLSAMRVTHSGCLGAPTSQEMAKPPKMAFWAVQHALVDGCSPPVPFPSPSTGYRRLICAVQRSPTCVYGPVKCPQNRDFSHFQRFGEGVMYRKSQLFEHLHCLRAAPPALYIPWAYAKHPLGAIGEKTIFSVGISIHAVGRAGAGAAGSCFLRNENCFGL